MQSFCTLSKLNLKIKYVFLVIEWIWFYFRRFDNMVIYNSLSLDFHRSGSKKSDYRPHLITPLFYREFHLKTQSNTNILALGDGCLSSRSLSRFIQKTLQKYDFS